MATGTEFLIQLQQRITGASITTELAKLEQSFTAAKNQYTALETEATKLSKSYDRVSGSVGDLRARMDAYMKAGDAAGFWKAAAALQAFEKEQARLGKAVASSKSALADQAANVQKLGEQLAGAKASQSKFDAAAKSGAALKKLGGPIGKLGDSVNDTLEAFDGLSASIGAEAAAASIAVVGAIALVAAFGAIGLAVAAGAGAVLLWSLKLADNRREVELSIDAMSRSGAASAALSQAFGDISRDTGIASARLLDVTRSLKAAHIASSQIPDALRAIALQEAALGDTSGTQELIDKLKTGQTTAAALASDMDRRVGGVVQKRMLGLAAQSATLQRNLGDVFGALDWEPVLIGISKLVGLLDASSESGRAIRKVFESMVRPLIDNAVPIFATVERFLLGIVLAVLDVAIFMKRAAKAVGEFLDAFGIGTDSLSQFVDIADVGYYGFLALLGVVTLVGVAAGLMLLPFIAAGAIAIGVAAVFVGAIYGIYSAGQAIKAMDWASIGQGIIDGLLAPVRAAAGVPEAFRALAETAKTALTGALEIHSPSRVFAGYGGDVVDGFVGGVDGAAPDARSAVERLGSLPAGQGGVARGGEIAFHQENHYYGVKDAEDAAERSRGDMVELLELAGLQVGG